MATFPGALITFTDRANDVDTVQAVDVNSAYDEIEAIEAELGVAPSGASATVAARFTAVESRNHSTWGALTADDHTNYVYLLTGVDADKPSSGYRLGRVYRTTDTGKTYWDTGSAWVLIASTSHADLSALTTGDPHTQYFPKTGGEFGAYRETRTQGNATGAMGLNPATSNNYDYTLTGDVVFTLASGTASKFTNITVVLRQDATGGRSVSFTPVEWSQGFVPSFPTTANSISLVAFLWTGVEWLGVQPGINFA